MPVRRVAALAPVCDMARAGEPVHELLGGTPDEVPERYAATDPMQLLPIGVPTLIVHGADDATVSVKRSRAYAEAARAAGDQVELVEPPSAPHRSHADPRTDAWRVTADWVTAGTYSPLAGTIPD